MTFERALDFAIFALNTLAHPDASSQNDLDALDANTEATLDALAQLRRLLRRDTAEHAELAEVFGDAIAYRTNSGEGADSDEDQATADRFQRLADRLRVTPD